MEKSVKDRLRKLGVKPTKGLGQNFLEEGNIAKKIVKHANITKSDKILEIGPGLGVLTDYIVERAGKTILIEKDKGLTSYLEGRYSNYEIEIIQGDVLEVELPDFDSVVSNLPFSISSPVTFKLLKCDFKVGILTYQQQFAERMTAKVGEKEYSRLSVMVSVYAEVEKLFNISKKSFHPPPKVDASVIRLIPSKPDFDLKNQEIFSKVVKELFNYRRKKIKNALKTGLDVKAEKVPYRDKRVGNLSPEQINEVVNHLIEKESLEEG
ncbi:MAG: ribosomal RNA small subunit methyltransferase A, partial [Candidatus Thermoplasmatota archaeon]|nr:ribosomal RNA small subunit methyltransferase A [Candidatus Thermoplasmatota archaeon]